MTSAVAEPWGAEGQRKNVVMWRTVAPGAVFKTQMWAVCFLGRYGKMAVFLGRNRRNYS